MKLYSLLLLTAIFSITACSPAEEEEEHGEGVAEEVCEHFVEGPELAIAAAELAADAPDVSTEHTRHDITLTSDPAFVQYESDEEGEVIVAVGDAAYTLTFTQSDAEISVEVEDLAEFDCALGAAFLVPVAVGLVDIQIAGPQGDVSIVIEHYEEGEDHDHEEEEEEDA